MRRRSGLLGLVLSLVLLVSLAVPVDAAPTPHAFWGTLTIGGSLAPEGTELTAVVEGGGGSYTTTVVGQYGSATDPFDKLVVSGDIEGGALIEFYTGGAKADQTATFFNGRTAELNLTFPAAETFTITATAGENGAIEPSGDVVVNSGADQLFAITPDTGYVVDDVLVDDGSVGAAGSYLFENVTANHTIHATFAAVPPETFTITATAGENGSILPAGVVVVNSGADQLFAITPDTGYVVEDVLVDDVSVGAAGSYLFEDVTDNHTIHATFAAVPPETFTITATAGENGSISPLGAVVVNSGASQAFTITPDTGYVVEDVLVDDGSVGAVGSYTFTNVTADHTIHATFVLVGETFTITATAGEGGSISPSGAVVVNSGASQAFTITPDTGYVVLDVLVDDVSEGAVTSYTFVNVTANHTIHATFVTGEPPETFTITATAGEGGSISPAGAVVVVSGANQLFTITELPDYDVADVLIDDVSVGTVTIYFFPNVTADHTIHATFEGAPVYFTTPLLPEWNLLSTPIKLAADSDAIEQIFGTTSRENILILYNWDAVGEKWDPILAGYKLLPLYAIYVKVKPDASATAVFISCGELSFPPSRELQPGLNLIGPAPAFVDGNFEVMPLDQALISIAEAGSLTGYTMVISPEHNQPGWAYGLGGEIRDLLPYQGYWVVMENADTLLGWSTTPIQ